MDRIRLECFKIFVSPLITCSRQVLGVPSAWNVNLNFVLYYQLCVCVCVRVCCDLKRYPSVIFLTVCPHCKLLAPDFHTIISLSFPFCPYSLASLFRKRWSCPRLCYPREEVLARPRLSLLRVYHSRLAEQRPVFRPSAERFSWCNPQTGHNISFSSGCIRNTYSHFWFSGLKV